MTDKNRKENPTRDDESDPTALAPLGFSVPEILHDFMKPFDELVGVPFKSFGSPWTELPEPSTDIQDRGDHYVVTAELPGFDKKDVEVRVSDSTIELRGEKRTEKESEEGRVSQALSSSSYLQRHVYLPELVVSEKVSGTMKNGVLELRLPKREPKAQERSRKVDLR